MRTNCFRRSGHLPEAYPPPAANLPPEIRFPEEGCHFPPRRHPIFCVFRHGCDTFHTRIVLGRQTAVPEMILRGPHWSSRSSFRGASGADVPSSPPESLSGWQIVLPMRIVLRRYSPPANAGCPRCARHPRQGRPHARPESRRFPPCQGGPPGAVPRRLSARRAAWQRSLRLAFFIQIPPNLPRRIFAGHTLLCALSSLKKTVETPTITTIYTYTRARVYHFETGTEVCFEWVPFSRATPFSWAP